MLTTSQNVFVALGALASVAFVVVACGSSADSTFADPNASSGGFGSDGGFGINEKPDSGDLLANDPFPQTCGANAPKPPPAPGGTLDCPDDKNKPGCSCTTVGEEAACWTGLRAKRNLGVCKDGRTKCFQKDETSRAWGPCEGQVGPEDGKTRGAQACKCFSLGKWKLKNLVPCIQNYCTTVPDGGQCEGDNVTTAFAVSSVDNSPASCADQALTPPPKAPAVQWTTDTLTVDCAGHYRLCYEIKAGDFANPQATDCSIAKPVCVEADYLKAGVEQAFPPLAAWVSSDPAEQACVKKWNVTGGYGEMRVMGESELCDKIDNGTGGSYVFNRIKYCSPICRNGAHADLPECQGCGQEGKGEF